MPRRKKSRGSLSGNGPGHFTHAPGCKMLLLSYFSGVLRLRLLWDELPEQRQDWEIDHLQKPTPLRRLCEIFLVCEREELLTVRPLSEPAKARSYFLILFRGWLDL